MGQPGTAIFGMSASLLFRISDGRGAGDPQSAHPGARLKKMNIDQTAQEMSVIGVDISLEHLDIHCLPCGTSMRLPNDSKGHDKLVALAREKKALVGFEATGGCEWCPWIRLVEEGVRVRQHPPKQIKHYGLAYGKGAKTDKDDAKLIALFMQYRPDAGRELPSDVLRKLRAHVTFRAQIVEAGKRPEKCWVWGHVRPRDGRAAGSALVPNRRARGADTVDYRVRRDVRRMAIALTTMPGSVS